MSSNHQPLMLAPRADLHWQRQAVRGQELILVVDPVQEQQWYWRPEEWFLWQQLTSHSSRDSLQQAWQQRYLPQRIQCETIQTILNRMWQHGLLLGPALPCEPTTSTGQRWLQWLAITGPGWRPTTLCRWLQPLAKSCTSSWLLLAWLLLIISAGLVLFRHWNQVVSESLQLFQPERSWHWIMWLLIWAGLKSWHELGHLLAATAVGLRVQRLGLMFWLGIPTLACTINSAWQAPRRQRLLVNAGGMLAELALAAVAWWLWSWSSSAWTRDLWLQIGLLGTMNTLLVNGNPLLRYDGYYLLSDALELPNMAQQANLHLRRWLWQAAGLSTNELEQPWQTHRWPMQCGLIAYAIAAPIYRWFLAWAMIWFVAERLRPWGLVTPSRLLGLIFLLAFTVPPLLAMQRLIRQLTLNANEQRWPGLQLRLLGMLVCMALLGLIPWSRTTTIPMLWQSPQSIAISATVPGHLQVAPTAYNSLVTVDQPLILLMNPELQQRLVAQQGEVAQRGLHLEQLRLRQNDPLAAAELNTAMTAWQESRAQLAELERQYQQLTITAPRAGNWLPPRSRQTVTAPQIDEQGTRFVTQQTERSWQGLPSELRNQGAWIEAGTDLGYVVPTQQLQGWGLVTQAELADLELGQAVELTCDALPGSNWSGIISELATYPVQQVPPEWQARLGRELRVLNSADQSWATRQTMYAVQMTVQPNATEPIWGTTGRAKVTLSNRSYWSRCLNWWQRTFHWESW